MCCWREHRPRGDVCEQPRDQPRKESPKSEEQRWLIQTRGVEVQGDVESGSSVTELHRGCTGLCAASQSLMDMDVRKLAFRLDANAGAKPRYFNSIRLRATE